LTWENDQKSGNLIKINGDKDKLLPPSYALNEIIIQGGQHLMIVDEAQQISKIINLELNKLNS